MNNGIISIRNWDKYQHYKDRDPPWFKLYGRALLADRDFMSLPVADRFLAVGLMALAAETGNETPHDPEWIRWRLRLDGPPNVDALVSIGFVEVYEDDSSPLATRYQDASPEGETEGETEAERETALSAKDEVDRIVEIVNTHRDRAGLSQLRGGDQTGRGYIRARIREYDFPTVEAVAWCAPRDKWISETTERLALAPIFSPKSFPRILDRLENDHTAPTLSGGDRKIIDMRQRLEAQGI